MASNKSATAGNNQLHKTYSLARKTHGLQAPSMIGRFGESPLPYFEWKVNHEGCHVYPFWNLVYPCSKEPIACILEKEYV